MSVVTGGMLQRSKCHSDPNQSLIMNRALCEYTTDIVWIAPEVGDWRSVCLRCDFSIEASEFATVDLAIRSHVCDPKNKKT